MLVAGIGLAPLLGCCRGGWGRPSVRESMLGCVDCRGGCCSSQRKGWGSGLGGFE
jgi:hypothetical protein